MRITLKGFRCYEYTVYELENDKLTLINGKSGVGKAWEAAPITS